MKVFRPAPEGVHRGSDRSAACGGRSDLSEWQRSADDAAGTARNMPGTATGRAARSRGNMLTNTSGFDRLRGQRLPYAIFFGYFLAWLQESDTYRFYTIKKNTETPIYRNSRSRMNCRGCMYVSFLMVFTRFPPFLPSVRCGGSGNGGRRRDRRYRRYRPGWTRDRHAPE